MQNQLSDVEAEFEHEISNPDDSRSIQLNMEDTDQQEFQEETMGEGVYMEDFDVERQTENPYGYRFFEVTSKNYEDTNEVMELKRELHEIITDIEQKHFWGKIKKGINSVKNAAKKLIPGLSLASLFKLVISKLPESIRKQLLDIAVKAASSLIPGGSIVAQPIIKKILNQVGLKFEYVDNNNSKLQFWNNFANFTRNAYEYYAELVLENAPAVLLNPSNNLLATSKALKKASNITQKQQTIQQGSGSRRKKKTVNFNVAPGVRQGKVIVYLW